MKNILSDLRVCALGILHFGANYTWFQGKCLKPGWSPSLGHRSDHSPPSTIGLVALKEITLQEEEGVPFTAIREASLLKGYSPNNNNNNNNDDDNNNNRRLQNFENQIFPNLYPSFLRPETCQHCYTPWYLSHQRNFDVYFRIRGHGFGTLPRKSHAKGDPE